MEVALRRNHRSGFAFDAGITAGSGRHFRWVFCDGAPPEVVDYDYISDNASFVRIVLILALIYR